MQTNLAKFIKNTPEGQEADAILRSCVHCGFCTATCPTYQLLGDELDGPRGRIYLIKQLLEGKAVSAATRTHLDRCLTCLACETTCPSGVQYGRLLDLGRALTEKKVPRGGLDRLRRAVLTSFISRRKFFLPLLRVGQLLRPLMPKSVADFVPRWRKAISWPSNRHQRKMIVLRGCVQEAATPNTNAATARVLDRLAISSVSVAGEGCCGALSHHLSARQAALDSMRKNIDAWWPHIENGIEAIVTTASGCGFVVKEYGRILAHDSNYAHKAQQVSALSKDIAEVLAAENFSLKGNTKPVQSIKVAFQPPCTLQHGQKITGAVESLLQRLGFQLTEVANSHLCCGSAGVYSILQPEIAGRLRQNKLQALQNGKPDVIATANIGCQLHLETRADVPVKHWVELLDEAIKAL